VTPKRLYNFMIDPDLAEGIKQLKATDPELSEGQIVRKALREYRP
jgi:hypothetical protein